jgi:signal peptidase
VEITTTPRRATYTARALRLLVNLACAVAVVAALGLLVPAAFGLERYVITGSSMSGTYEVGSIVFAEVVPVADLGEGDVITYLPPADSGIDHLVTHRIVSIEDGVFRTQGDAIDHPDPWTFTLTEATQARVRYDVPFIGHAFLAMQDRGTRTLVIGIPAGLIALASLVQVLRGLRIPGTPRRRTPAADPTTPSQPEAVAPRMAAVGGP